MPTSPRWRGSTGRSRTRDEPGPCRAVGEIGDPGPVRRRGAELPVQQILRPAAVLIGDGGAGSAAADPPPHPFLAHQPIHGVLGDTRVAVAGQPGGHLATPVEHLWPRPARRAAGTQLPQRVQNPGIVNGPHRRRSRFPRPVGARGDRQAQHPQGPADRLDPAPAGGLLIDERDDQRRRGSVKSVRGAVPFLRPARFPGPLPAPGVHLSMHRALHKPRRVGRDRRIRRRTARGSG
jgi:hypothetical protein